MFERSNSLKLASCCRWYVERDLGWVHFTSRLSQQHESMHRHLTFTSQSLTFKRRRIESNMARWPIMIFSIQTMQTQYRKHRRKVAIRVRDTRRSHDMCVVQCMQKLFDSVQRVGSLIVDHLGPAKRGAKLNARTVSQKDKSGKAKPQRKQEKGGM